MSKDGFFSSIFPWLTGLVVIALAVFSPSLSSNFVYDSGMEIVLWDFIHDPANILTPLTFRLMGMDAIDFNRPVSVSSLMFDSLVWGKNPFGYHLTNILLHALATCLVFMLVRRFLSLKKSQGNPTRRNEIAFLAALIFAVHPLMAETVCEPTYRRDILAALFGFTALLLTMRHQSGMGAGDVLRIFLCPLLCLLAVGSKEVGIAFPAILFFYWLLFRRDEPGRFWVWTLGTSAIVVTIFLIFRFAFDHNNTDIVSVPPDYPGGSLGAALLIQPRILTQYLINFFWPFYLCADYNGYSVRFIYLPIALLALALVLIPLGIWSWKDRRVCFAAGVISCSLLPVFNLIPIYHPLADRYLYIPLAGVALLIALALDGGWFELKYPRLAIWFGFVSLALGLLIPVTLQREQVWSSDVALWQDTLERNPASFPARANLPESLYNAGRISEAKEESEATLQTPYAKEPWIWVDYALELNRLGDRPGAEKAARHAIELKPDVIDTNKMIRTFQCLPNIAVEFAQLAASLPRQPGNLPQK